MTKKLLIALRNRKEAGASMLEYALLAALISVVCVAAITTIGENAKISFEAIGTAIETANDKGNVSST
jgi:pilus assembly protein Flp/PilA